MKTIFIILIIIFISGYIFSLDIHGYLETGYITRGKIISHGYNLLPDKKSGYIDIQIYTKLFFLETGGNIKTYVFFRNETFTFRPIFMEYTFFIRTKIDNIEFGFSHTCGHSIHIKDNYPRLDNGEEKIYIKLIF